MADLVRLAATDIHRVDGLNGKRGDTIHKSGVTSVADLLWHVPRTYIDRTRQVAMADVPLGQEVTVHGRIKSISLRRPRRGLVLVEATVTDGVSDLKVVWFNQGFRHKQLPPGTEVVLSGTVEIFNRRRQMNSPGVDVLSTSTESLDTSRIVPIHPVIGDVSAAHIRRAVHNALKRSRPIPDTLPDQIKVRAGVRDREWAYGAVHFPDSIEDVAPARNRLVFDEFFRLEVALAVQKRRQEEASRGVSHSPGGNLARRFTEGLPYALTGAQRRVVGEIEADLARPHAMHRLLQGEVGSGKTVVAVVTLLAGIEGGWQGAVMAPTEVLAEQHYLAITALLASAGLDPELEGAGAGLGMDSLFESEGPSVRLALLTRSRALLSHRPDAKRAEVVAAIASGDVEMVVGTHALIQEDVDFHRLGVAVIDEQHRFGVAQRVRLRSKADDVDPDLLIMTATPIPRTLSMTVYGDLDVSTIDEMPPGRTPVRTTFLPWADQDRAWVAVRAEAEAGRQAFVVCPLVEDSPKVEAASAETEYSRLQDVLTGLRVGLIHGQMHPRDKEAVMAAFRAGEIDVLVATTVIEVGIDVPNATVMVIEDADRFGLSQLHQLRGRVGRGVHPGRCILIADPAGPDSEDRIKAMVRTNDGFELAIEDLRIRGQGTVFDVRQSGMADFKLADLLRDFKLLEVARDEAFALVERDPELEGHPDLVAEIGALLGDDVEWLFSEARA